MAERLTRVSRLQKVDSLNFKSTKLIQRCNQVRQRFTQVAVLHWRYVAENGTAYSLTCLSSE